MIIGLKRLRIFSFNEHIGHIKAQIEYEYLPDPDFELFEFIDHPGGLVIDAGANRGHCSVAVLSRTRHLRVHAFEANKALAKPLNYLKKRFPGRFEFTIRGLGAHPREAQLKVPQSRLNDISTNASFRDSEYEKSYVRERLETESGTPYKELGYASHTVKIRTLDSFSLKPIAIKIDVEGYELEVIEGALETIKAHKPLLMIEMNNQEEFLPLLDSLGYGFYRYDPKTKTLIQFPENETYLNVICLHGEKRHFSHEMILPNPAISSH